MSPPLSCIMAPGGEDQLIHPWLCPPSNGWIHHRPQVRGVPQATSGKTSPVSPLCHLHCLVAPSHATIPASCYLSPKTGSSTFGYIFFDAHEHHRQEPVTAYFTSTGREVYAFLCPDLDAFPRENFLCTRDVSFVSDLPWYAILLWHWIIKDNTNSDKVAHNQSWLPGLPSMAFHSRSSSLHDNLALLGFRGPRLHSGPQSMRQHPSRIDPTTHPPLLVVPLLHPPSIFPMGQRNSVFWCPLPPHNRQELELGGGHCINWVKPGLQGYGAQFKLFQF
jgi:hypothetical protein